MTKIIKHEKGTDHMTTKTTIKYSLETDSQMNVHHIWRIPGNDVRIAEVTACAYDGHVAIRSDMPSASNHADNLEYMRAIAEAFPIAIALYESLTTSDR